MSIQEKFKNPQEEPIDLQTTNAPDLTEYLEEITVPIVPEAVPELTKTELKDTVIVNETLPDIQIANIDTSTLAEPQGNWLFKRMWFERAQETYQKLKDLVDKVMDQRVDFFKQRSVLDKDLFDTFYMELGMGLGEFSTLVNELIDKINTESMSEKSKIERQTLLDTLQSEKAALEQLKKNIDGLKAIDNAIEDAVGIVIEVINKVRRYERDGWEYFIEIGKILNDKKARELFYRLDIALQNIKQLANYLDNAFFSYFSSLESRARSTTAQLHSQLIELKVKGIDLKAKVSFLEEAQEPIQEKIPVSDPEELEEEAQPKNQNSWWRTMINPISSLWRITVDTIKSFF